MLLLDGNPQDVSVTSIGRDVYRFAITGAPPTEVRISEVGQDSISIANNGRTIKAFYAKTARGDIAIGVDGKQFIFTAISAGESVHEDAAPANRIAAAFPGIVKIVNAKSGDAVKKGDALIVMEAMKMDHTLSAPRDGVVAEVLTAPGAQVSEGAVLVTLEESPA